MEILLVRHAAALQREGWRLDDALRPLSARGRRRFRRVVEMLAEVDARMDVILTSPLVRTVQTAEILAGARGFDGEVEIAPALAPGFSVSRLVEALAARPEKALAVVGHEPHMSELAEALLGEPLGIPFKKGMVLAVDVRFGRGPAQFRFTLLPGSRRPLTARRELERRADGEGR
jgi:phosphohistidine phosphatase